MSYTVALSKSYGSFFWGCTKFAVSPYTNTFMAVANSNNPNDSIEDCLSNTAAAALVVGVFTFVVPVLPVIASITFALSSIAMLAAVASMFVTYPGALLADACTQTDFDWELGNQMSYAYRAM